MPFIGRLDYYPDEEDKEILKKHIRFQQLLHWYTLFFGLLFYIIFSYMTSKQHKDVLSQPYHPSYVILK